VAKEPKCVMFIKILQVVIANNDGKSAASFDCQATALVPDMFCKFNLVKNHKSANNSATTEAREKIYTFLESLEFYFLCMFD